MPNIKDVAQVTLSDCWEEIIRECTSNVKMADRSFFNVKFGCIPFSQVYVESVNGAVCIFNPESCCVNMTIILNPYWSVFFQCLCSYVTCPVYLQDQAILVSAWVSQFGTLLS